MRKLIILFLVALCFVDASTTPSQVPEVWAELMNRYERSGLSRAATLNPPVSEREIRAWERGVGRSVPPELKTLWTLSNGQRQDEPSQPGTYPAALIDGFVLLSARESREEWEMWRDLTLQEGLEGMQSFAEAVVVDPNSRVRKQYWNTAWIPFARDGSGNGFALDFAPTALGRSGQVIIYGPDEDYRYVVADGLGELLREMLKRWRSGKLRVRVIRETLEVDFDLLRYLSD